MKDIGYFTLAWYYYEDYVPYFFIGPENCSEKQFQNICDGLLTQASLNALAKESSEEYPSYVGWQEIIVGMIPLLEEIGFINIKTKSAKYFGPQIIDDKSDCGNLSKVSENILVYNKTTFDNFKFGAE